MSSQYYADTTETERISLVSRDTMRAQTETKNYEIIPTMKPQKRVMPSPQCPPRSNEIDKISLAPWENIWAPRIQTDEPLNEDEDVYVLEETRPSSKNLKYPTTPT